MNVILFFRFSKCVRSKYFVGQTAMDESLSDFQEAKPSCKGPKPVQKSNKPKTRKVTKCIKGQKDIRTALKGKKNDLILYSKDFDNVCKKSGVDVDSEQLQLAIALSKSLQAESSSNPESSQTIPSQERVAKIRKTLQEYGFKVPEPKITNKRAKKHRKEYKLLTTTEDERHQKITGKYSEILFENFDSSKLEYNNSIDQDSDAKIFYFAANIPYEYMKDNSIFYVDNLLEKSITSGCLLRDWSTIPGRPQSPKLYDTITMNFKEIDCSQDELDVILSGSIKSVKDIIASKQIEHKSKYRDCEIPKFVIDDDDNEEKVSSDVSGTEIDNQSSKTIDDQADETENKSPFQKAFKMKSPVKKVLEVSPVKEVIEIKSPTKEVLVNSKPFDEEVIDVEAHNKLTQQYRSCSPDIFDDELSSIMEVSKPINGLSQELKTKVFTEDNFMDLTQGANVLSQNSEKSSQLSQNITKRKSNDYMEITECIVGSSQQIRENLKEIDLTRSPDKKKAILEENCGISIHFNTENVNLRQSLYFTDQNPNDSINQNITDKQNETVVLNHPDNLNAHQTPKDNIDLTQSSNEDDEKIIVTEENNQISDNGEFETMDLTQSSNSSNHSHDLPLVYVGNSQTQKSLDDTILINEDEYLGILGKGKKSMAFENEAPNRVLHLTQEVKDTSIEYNPSPVMGRNTETANYSFYEDFEHDHSANTENSKSNELDIDLSKEYNNSSHNTKSKESNDIDLTQSSDTSEEMFASPEPRPVTTLQNPNNSSLGKQDNVSIDYDEMLRDDNVCNKENFKESDNDNSLMLKYDSSKSAVYDDVEIVETNNECDINSSQNSEVFNISDKELDYSMHKSRHDIPRDNFDFGGISVLDNVTKLSFRKSLSEGNYNSVSPNKNVTMEDSFLPEVCIKKTDIKNIDTDQNDPENPKESSVLNVQEVLDNNNGVITIQTPKNSEYILKTDNVTPMMDYASMSTPQRNRELDKYGLKPFKRKRGKIYKGHIMIKERFPDITVFFPYKFLKLLWSNLRKICNSG